MHPFLLRKDDKTVELGYLWSDAEFHDPEVIEAIKKHPDAGKLGKMMGENPTWNMPDFRRWGSVYQLGIRPVPQLGNITIPSVHDNVVKITNQTGRG